MWAKVQHADAPDESPALNKENSKRIQTIIGSLLHCARAVDNKLLVTLRTIAIKTHSPIILILNEVNHLLDYVATYPDDGMLFH